MSELGVVVRASQAEKPEALTEALEKLFADPNRALLEPDEVWWESGGSAEGGPSD